MIDKDNTAGAFTPGPWTHGLSDNRRVPCVRNVDTWICGELYNPDSPNGIPLSEAQANARLIAAAPELYEALICALPYIESELDNAAYKRGAVAKVVAKMNAAIAKAEGR